MNMINGFTYWWPQMIDVLNFYIYYNSVTIVSRNAGWLDTAKIDANYLLFYGKNLYWPSVYTFWSTEIIFKNIFAIERDISDRYLTCNKLEDTQPMKILTSFPLYWEIDTELK